MRGFVEPKSGVIKSGHSHPILHQILRFFHKKPLIPWVGSRDLGRTGPQVGRPLISSKFLGKAAGTRSLKTPIRRQRPRRPLGAAPFGRASRAGRSKSTLACPRDSLGSSSPGVAEPRVTGSEKCPPPKKPVRRKSRPTASEMNSKAPMKYIVVSGGTAAQDSRTKSFERGVGPAASRASVHAHTPPGDPDLETCTRSSPRLFSRFFQTKRRRGLRPRQRRHREQHRRAFARRGLARDVHQDRPVHQHRRRHDVPVRARRGVRSGRRRRSRPGPGQLRAIRGFDFDATTTSPPARFTRASSRRSARASTWARPCR